MSSLLLDSSPKAVAESPLVHHHGNEHIKDLALEAPAISFDDLLRQLPNAVHQRKQRCVPAGSPEDPIQKLFERVHVRPQDWERYSLFDTERNYTRNLIATDDETYTLLLLCWNPNKESPIHDHPCDGCWMRVLRGQVRECRYQPETSSSNNGWLQCTQDRTFSEGGVVFIEDSQGFHKVGNPGVVPAVTLHLYSPPFEKCQIWLNENARKPCQSCVCYYSEYGQKMA